MNVAFLLKKTFSFVKLTVVFAFTLQVWITFFACHVKS